MPAALPCPANSARYKVPLAGRGSVVGRRVWPVLSAGLFTLIALVSFAGWWVP